MKSLNQGLATFVGIDAKGHIYEWMVGHSIATSLPNVRWWCYQITKLLGCWVLCIAQLHVKGKSDGEQVEAEHARCCPAAVPVSVAQVPKQHCAEKPMCSHTPCCCHLIAQWCASLNLLHTRQWQSHLSSFKESVLLPFRFLGLETVGQISDGEPLAFGCWPLKNEPMKKQ